MVIAVEYQTLSLVHKTKISENQFQCYIRVTTCLQGGCIIALRENLKQLLSTVDQIAVTTNGRTSSKNQSFQSLTKQFILKNDKLMTITKNLSEKIKQLLTTWGVSEKVSAAVSKQ